ncbi:MAG: glycerate kinase, partial [Defluviitaleaceae bacterium]|nr:glycerate kinase [Defluviitaleaceae bacterium]
MKIHDDAQIMIKAIIEDNMPRISVENALKQFDFGDAVYMVAIGKAAWTMAEATVDFLDERLERGIVITKYDHSNGEFDERVEVYEAGHPVADQNTFDATARVIEMVQDLTYGDELIFLVSGGGSALFEKPLEGITLHDIQDITSQLLKSGADIVEMNMIRKRLSAVKAGRFAETVAPAHIYAIILSDVVGDRLDSIASGPAVPDNSTAEDAAKVVKFYELKLNELQESYLKQETPKSITNVETVITGSVSTLVESASRMASQLGYTPYVLTTTMVCEAAEAGRLIASMATTTADGRSSFQKPCAIILGGETVVKVAGSGSGGRNQEIALAAAKGIAGYDNILVFSLGSDGTDGPTDAAGGIVDGTTLAKLKTAGKDVDMELRNNDSYNALNSVGSLIMTG